MAWARNTIADERAGKEWKSIPAGVESRLVDTVNL